jgi:thiaminase
MRTRLKSKEDPVWSEIAYSALLTAVKKSDAYSSLQQLKKQGQNLGFSLWKELQEMLTGEDCKAYNRKLLSKKLGDTWKTQWVSLLACKGEMEEVFRLAKAAGENWDEQHWMEEFLNHFDDPEWKSYISECARDVSNKKITTVAALYSDLSGEEW